MNSKLIQKFTIILLAALFVSALFIHKLHAHGKEKHTQSAAENEVSYIKDIKPLFNKRCAKCHGSKSPVHMEFVKDVKGYKKQMKGPRMDSYTYLTSFVIWPGTGSLMRALDNGRNTDNGKQGKMYKHLGATDEERHNNLKLFKDWVGHWTLKDWDNITKEELSKIKLAY